MSDPEIMKMRVLPPEARDLEMPSGTPLGIGLFGVWKFAAIKQVLRVAREAVQEKAALIDAQWQVGSAIVRRGLVLEQLDHLDAIREDEAKRILFGHTERIKQHEAQMRVYDARAEIDEIQKIEREVAKMEAQDRLAAKKASREAKRDRSTDGDAQDGFSEILAAMRRLPEVMTAVKNMREKIIVNAGGEDKLTEADRQSMEALDAWLNAEVQKKAMGSAL